MEIRLSSCEDVINTIGMILEILGTFLRPLLDLIVTEVGLTAYQKQLPLLWPCT